MPERTFMYATSTAGLRVVCRPAHRRKVIQKGSDAAVPLVIQLCPFIIDRGKGIIPRPSFPALPAPQSNKILQYRMLAGETRAKGPQVSPSLRSKQGHRT